MSIFQVRKVRMFNLFLLIVYLRLRWQIFVVEHKRGILSEFYLEDLTAKHYVFLLGNCAIGIARIINRGDSLELGRVAVKKAYRSKGYGKKVVDSLISKVLIREDIKTVSLFADDHMVSFYRQFGFVESGVKYFGDAAYIKMEKSLI